MFMWCKMHLRKNLFAYAAGLEKFCYCEIPLVFLILQLYNKLYNTYPCFLEILLHKYQPTLMRHPKSNNFTKLRSAVEHYLRDIHKRHSTPPTGSSDSL